MNIHGIDVNPGQLPALDRNFVPIHQFNRAFLASADQPLSIVVTRTGDLTAVFHTYVHGTPDMQDADRYYLDRLVKTLLWMKGGHTIHIAGNSDLYNSIRQAYSPTGTRAFDYQFMSRVYERELEIIHCDVVPDARENAQPIGRHLNGCRIGFDAGGSDRKVSAVVDGKVIYSEEVIWHPKTKADPDYHFQEIVAAFRSAAAHMDRVDAIGISSAGIYINNRTMVASLFLKVPEAVFDQKVKDIYLRAARKIGEVPITVCNDGDVTALAGAMSLGVNNLLGIAMGTSEAAGFVDRDGNITGWLNELAFAPVDASPQAMMDEWSGDIGCGVKYFSQDAVIKLAENGGIVFDENKSPAEKLVEVQELLAAGDPVAEEVFRSIGCYLGHTMAYYHDLYGFEHVLLLGRVTSGRGGDLVLSVARQVLRDEYPEISSQFGLSMPDEKARRVGQSVAAASLVDIG